MGHACHGKGEGEGEGKGNECDECKKVGRWRVRRICAREDHLVVHTLYIHTPPCPLHHPSQYHITYHSGTIRRVRRETRRERERGYPASRLPAGVPHDV